MLYNQKILILGGLGFIGAALVRHYHITNYITIVDKIGYENSVLKLMSLDLTNITIYKMDITNKKDFLNVGTDYDYIINVSALLGIKKVTVESIQTILTNLKCAENSLNLASKQSNLKKYITFSTSEIYGNTSDNATEHDPAIIGCISEPRWCYAASKITADHLTSAYHREYGIPVIIIRPFNIFGEYRKGSNASKSLLTKMLNNDDVYVDGDGKQLRAWCYIDDFILGVTKAIESNYVCEVFNIGNPHNQLTIFELAKLIKKLVKSKSKIEITNLFVPDIQLRRVSIDKARNLLGYEPKISLIEGIERMIKWNKAHESK